MAGIISGFLDGAGKAAAESGRMMLADQIAKEREEANFLRDKELKNSNNTFLTSERVAGQKFDASQTDKKIKSAEAISKNKTKNGNKPTNQAKNVKFLMSKEGGNKPLNEAVMLSFPGSKIKHTDAEGNQIVVVPNGKGKFAEVGRIVKDENGKQQWLNKGDQLENAAITKQHRNKAKEIAGDKAGFLTSDKTDFPSTGGDRKEFTKQEAQRLANKERSAKSGNTGIVNNSIKSSNKLPGGGETNPDLKTINNKEISREAYISAMIEKYGETNRSAIEKKWKSY